MTSPVSFAGIAAVVFFAHAALSAELMPTPGDRPPAIVRWLVRRDPPRNRHLALTTIPVLVGMQVLIGLGVAQPDRLASTTAGSTTTTYAFGGQVASNAVIGLYSSGASVVAHGGSNPQELVVGTIVGALAPALPGGQGVGGAVTGFASGTAANTGQNFLNTLDVFGWLGGVFGMPSSAPGVSSK